MPAEGNVIEERTKISTLETAARQLASLDDVLPSLPQGDAQQRALARSNLEAFRRLMKASVIAAVSETAVGLTYDSYDQAQSIRIVITDMIDDLLSDDGLDDQTYGPLTTLRADITEHFSQVAGTLPSLINHAPRASVPALVLAYRLYGDADLSEDLLARNPAIRDPSSLQGGVALRVLPGV